jgi:cytidyltransferase-like protein
MSTIVLCTGGYDPLHSGHIAYFEAAKALGDMLIVGVNSDAWLARKKGRSFMNQIERTAIIDALSVVDKTIWFNDDDGSACAAIEQVKLHYPNDDIVFANGGDRTRTNIPEMSVEGVMFRFGVGGENKMNSSSWILEEWKAPKTERIWGYYRVLHDVPGMKVKELTVNPGQSLSMQRHNLRSEYWIVQEGTAVVNSKTPSGYTMPPRTLSKYDEFHVPVSEWHQLTNPYDVPLRIVEIQYGEQCIEEDIERQ